MKVEKRKKWHPEWVSKYRATNLVVISLMRCLRAHRCFRCRTAALLVHTRLVFSLVGDFLKTSCSRQYSRAASCFCWSTRVCGRSVSEKQKQNAG